MNPGAATASALTPYRQGRARWKALPGGVAGTVGLATFMYGGVLPQIRAFAKEFPHIRKG